MNKKVFLIDFEQLPFEELSQVPFNFREEAERVIAIIPEEQDHVSLDLIQELQPLGEQLEWIKVDGTQENNLALHIAFALGRIDTRLNPAVEVVLISKNPFFKGLLQTLTQKERKFSSWHYQPTQAELANNRMEKAVAWLQDQPMLSRPQTILGLQNALTRFFDYDEAKAENCIERLKNDNKILVGGKTVFYQF